MARPSLAPAARLALTRAGERDARTADKLNRFPRTRRQLEALGCARGDACHEILTQTLERTNSSAQIIPTVY